MPKKGNFDGAGRKIKCGLLIKWCLQALRSGNRSNPAFIHKFVQNAVSFPGFLVDIFKVETIQVSKTAGPAPDDETTTSYRQVMEPLRRAVATHRFLFQLPGIVTFRFIVRTLSCDILVPWYEYTGCATVVTNNIRTVRHRGDHLVGCLVTVIAVNPVLQADKAFIHG
jgi:hypothetical protein